jgi:hypothetical protein
VGCVERQYRTIGKVSGPGVRQDPIWQTTTQELPPLEAVLLREGPAGGATMNRIGVGQIIISGVTGVWAVSGWNAASDVPVSRHGWIA